MKLKIAAITIHMLTMLPGLAYADFSCKQSEVGVELTLVTYQEDILEGAAPVAAILKGPQSVDFLKGTSESLITKTNQVTKFELINQKGEDLVFNIVTETKQNPLSLNCGRGSCDPFPILVETHTIPAVTIDGAQYELTCKKFFL